jgi:hypothetical protein
MNGQGDVAAAFRFELFNKTAAVGNDDGLVALLGQIFADFESAALDTAGVQLRENLDDFQNG